MQQTFERYEKKYIIMKEQYERLLSKLTGEVQEDVYSHYTISNVYFDTQDYELIRKSLEKPLYKEKLRLRSYIVPKEQDQVFVEIKKKFDSVVYKRRTAMTLKEAEAYLYNGTHPDIDCQVMKELDWFTAKYYLLPAVYLAYDRTAFRGVEDPELRITIDDNIRYRENNLKLSAGSAGKTLLPEDKLLMEIKVPGRMPLWLSHILSQEKIFSDSFSKYGTYYQQNTHLLMKGRIKYA